MNKAECLKYAANARHESKVANESAIVLANVFGGSDSTVQDALQRRDVADEAASKWEWMARLHPATRNSLLRKQQLPLFMFRFAR